MRDFLSKFEMARQASAAPTDTTPVVSSIFAVSPGGTVVVVETGTLADVDATFDVKFEHGDDSGGSDMANVGVNDLIRGSDGKHPTANPIVSAFVFSDDNKNFKWQYIGAKSYLRVTVTPVANALAAPIYINSLKFGMRKGPGLNV